MGATVRVDRQTFEREYLKGVDEVLRHWTPAMQADLAKHNAGWRDGRLDFAHYLRASAERYYRAYWNMPANAKSVCDVGGFWGAFPLVLKGLGYEVTMTEEMAYYSDAFQPLFSHLQARGVRIADYDPFGDKASITNQFDYVTVMAVLEHYPHSLKRFMRNVLGMMNDQGFLYIEVPNIAFWPRRMRFLRGHSPLAPLREIFESETPFIGHHHEFSREELRDLVALSKLHLVTESSFNYSPGAIPSFSMLLRNPLQYVAFQIFPGSREVLAAVCAKAEA